MNFRDEALTQKEAQVEKKNTRLSEKLATLDEKEKELDAKIDIQVVELERIASLSSQDARKELFEIVEKRICQLGQAAIGKVSINILEHVNNYSAAVVAVI